MGQMKRYSITSQNSISTYFERILFWRVKSAEFHAVFNTREDFFIHVSITNVGLIFTQIGRFHFSDTLQHN